MPAPTVPHRAVEPAQITPTPPAPAQRILAAGSCFMCPGGNPTDRREFSRISAAAIRDARRALPAYTENQPKSAHRSPMTGVFDFSIFNYVVLTTELGANSPNSPSRRARQHRNLKFRCFNNVNNFANRKCTHISGSAASNRGTHPQACRITSDPALVSISCLHANASTFFLAPSNRTPPNRIPLKPSAPPSPLRAAAEPAQITPNTVTVHMPVRSGTHSAAPEKEKCLTEADTIPYRIEFTRARSCRNEGSGSKRLRSCEFR